MSQERFEKVASIMKFRGNRDEAIIWMSKLPKIPKAYEVKVTFEELRKGNHLIWTEEGGLKVLR